MAGPTGATGPQGPQGPQGPAGPAGINSYVFRYSTNSDRTISGGAEFVFDSGNVPSTPVGILLPNTTDTVLTEAGDYLVTFEANVLGTLTSVSINLNGLPVPGGTTGDTATTIRVEITAIVQVTTVPATITVTNDSFISITFPDLAPGSVVASLTILKLS